MLVSTTRQRSECAPRCLAISARGSKRSSCAAAARSAGNQTAASGDILDHEYRETVRIATASDKTTIEDRNRHCGPRQSGCRRAADRRMPLPVYWPRPKGRAGWLATPIRPERKRPLDDGNAPL